MNRKPIQRINEDLKKAVISYHEWHRDRKIELRGFVCDAEGNSMILTRVVDEEGERKSVLLEFDFHHEPNAEGDYIQVWDVIERYSCDREDEFEMIQSYMNN